jgi:Icc-related predicted phosphoesterase
MFPCLFVSDLHGVAARYRALWDLARRARPRAILLGGDLLPGGLLYGAPAPEVEGDFIEDFLEQGFLGLAADLGAAAPEVLLVLGNDDPAVTLPAFARGEARGAWRQIHGRRVALEGHPLFGYACVPPTPFVLKDWERYDVSRFVDPGCVSPEEGWRSVPMPEHQVRFQTIQRELDELVGEEDLRAAVLLCHSPPYHTGLDDAGLAGKLVDHAPLDTCVGSIALRRLIEARQPLLTLHGHVHGSARRTGIWKERLGETVMITAAHDGPELCVVRVDLDDPWAATRELVPVAG